MNKISINAESSLPGDIHVTSDGEKLGKIQSVCFKASVGSFATLQLESLITSLELKALQKNTTFIFKPYKLNFIEKLKFLFTGKI